MTPIKKYFHTLESVISGSNSDESIYDITKEMADKAGYRRESYVLKNGKIRDRSIYDRPFDDILTAKWLCFYKPLFVGRLSQHPELHDYHTAIINDTFLKVMRNIDFSVVNSGAALTTYVVKVFGTVVFDRIASCGSLKKAKTNKRIAKKRAVNIGVLPIEDDDAISTKVSAAGDSFRQGEMVDGIELDLRLRLKDSKIGTRLLSYLLGTCGKVNPRKIDEVVYLDDSEKTKENLIELDRAYKIIRDTVMEYVGCEAHPYSEWKNFPPVSFSSGVRSC